MQYQQKILKPELVDEKKKQVQLTNMQGFPLQGSPNVGQKIQSSQLQPQCVQPFQNSQSGQEFDQFSQINQSVHQDQQRVLVVPTTIAVTSTENQVANDQELREYSSFFNGCNCYFVFLALLFLYFRCLAAFDKDSNQGTLHFSITAGIFFILSYFFFIIGSFCGLHSLNKCLERFLYYYLVFVRLALIFEILGSIFTFIVLGYKHNEIQNYDKEAQHYRHIEIELTFFISIYLIVGTIILITFYGLSIRYARRIRVLMINLNLNYVTINESQQKKDPFENYLIPFG